MASKGNKTDMENEPKSLLDYYIEVEGVRFPKSFGMNQPLEEKIEGIRALELRGDDVLLCAYIKAGTHWVWEVCSMLLAGKAEYEKNVKVVAFLEATDLEKVRQLPSPRVLNTHVPVSMLPRELKAKKVKVIHVYRNVKDICVSMYFHFSQRVPMTFNQFFDEYFLNFDGNSKGNYFAYLKCMDEFIKANPDHPILCFSFEDMKEDPMGSVTRIAEFLGVPHNPELCRQVADACTIDKMREADKSKDKSSMTHLGGGKPVNIYRKGEVGDWKNHLTVAQSERLDAAMKQLEGCDFRFRYTP